MANTVLLRLSFKDTDARDENGELIREGKILVRKAVPVYENGKAPLTAFDKAKIEVKTPAENDGKPKYTVSFSKLGATTVTKKEEIPKSNELRLIDENGNRLCLYLKVPTENCQDFTKIKATLEIFNYGSVPVFIHFDDTKKTVRLSGGDLKINSTVVSTFEEILGKENVKTVYRKV